MVTITDAATQRNPVIASPVYAPSARSPMYLDRSKREPGKLLSHWNLVVPEWVLNRTWAEVT